MAVKGCSDPDAVYEVTGTIAARSRLQATAARGLTRFVGRDASSSNWAMRSSARQGHGQVVAIVGEPGVGKSRLVWELTHSHRVQGWLVLETGSVSYGKATQYLPVIDLFKALLPGRAPATRTGRSARRWPASSSCWTATLEPTLTPLLALLDVPVEDPRGTRSIRRSGDSARSDAVKRLLLRESQDQPVLVIFEDLHWIDAETQASARQPDGESSNGPRPAPGQLPSRVPACLGEQDLLSPAPAGPAAPGERRGRCSTVCWADATAPSSRSRLPMSGRGQPPLPRGERPDARGDPGADRASGARIGWRGPVEALQVPATVQAILAARIDRLPPEEKRLLQAAAVIGKDVPFPLLQAIAGEAEEACAADCDSCRTAEFLYETSLFPDLEYTFKHALTHEVAYGSLLQERRRLLHAQIVDAIERVYADRLTEQIERLAHHAIRGAQWQKAFRYLREAGTKAVTRSAYREAVAFWEEALRVVPHLPEAPETLEHAIDIRFELRHAVVQVEGLPSLLDHLLEAERLANTLGDKRRLGWVYDYLSNYHYNSGNHAEAAALATRALAIASDLGDFGLTLAATYHLGNAHYYAGRYHEAVELFQRCLQSLEKRPQAERYGLAVPPSILVRDWLALSLAELGEFSEGVRLTEEAVRIARHTARELHLTYASWVSGDVYLRQGDFDRASMALEEGLARCRAAFPGLLHNLAGPLGRAYVLSDRVGDAIPLLTEALACATSGGVIGRHSRLTTYLAEGYLHAHRAVEAREAALRALHLAREHQERGDEAWALNLLGEIAALADPPDVATAEAHYGAAMILASELGMRPLVAHCHLGLGKLYRRTGRREQAREHLITATTMYREMDMRFWLEQAETELRAFG